MASPKVSNTTVELEAKALMVRDKAETLTGLKTFDMGVAPPFAVAAGSTKVVNLDADKVDGLEASAFFRDERVQNVLTHGALPNPNTLGVDATVAIQAAIDAATAAGHSEVHIPAGVYRVAGTLTIHEGIKIKGIGGQGSSYISGVVIVHDSTGGLFLWDGNGASTLGTGGGLENILIVKQDGRLGGDAIKVLATNDNHRPGEMQFNNVLIYGIGTGQWDRALDVDGTACTTPGARGVRSIQLSKFRVADCQIDNEYIRMRDAVHVTTNHVQIDTGNGTGDPGLTISGYCENHNWANCIINGEFIVGATTGDDFHLTITGKVTTFTQGNTSARGGALIACQTFTNVSSSFRIHSSHNAEFLGVRTTVASDVTGNSNVYTVLYDSERFDANSDFNPATGRFTARSKASYHFNASVDLKGINWTHERVNGLFIRRNAAGVSQEHYYFHISDITTRANRIIELVSSSVANPSVITCSGNHGLATGDNVIIVGHVATPPLNQTSHGVTVGSPSTFTIPVNVTVGGTGGFAIGKGPSSLDHLIISGGITARMEAGDTMEVCVLVDGVSAIVDVYGSGSSVQYTHFSGHMV